MSWLHSAPMYRMSWPCLGGCRPIVIRSDRDYFAPVWRRDHSPPHSGTAPSWARNIGRYTPPSGRDCTARPGKNMTPCPVQGKGDHPRDETMAVGRSPTASVQDRDEGLPHVPPWRRAAARTVHAGRAGVSARDEGPTPVLRTSATACALTVCWRRLSSATAGTASLRIRCHLLYQNAH